MARRLLRVVSSASRALRGRVTVFVVAVLLVAGRDPFGFSVVTTGTAATEPDEPSQLVDTVISGIEHNYSEIRSARVTIEVALETPGVAEEKTVTYKAPGGRLVTEAMRPRSVTLYDFTLRGSDVLCRDVTTASETGDVFAVYDGVVKRYDPAHAMAWINIPEGMPSIAVLDPRGFPLRPQLAGVPAFLRAAKIERAEWVPDGADALMIRLRAKPPKGLTTLLECPAGKNFLPTLIAELHPDGSYCVLTSLTYQEVLPGAAWFLEKAVQKFFAKGIARDAEAAGWHQSLTIQTKGQALVNTEIPNETFQITWPAGTRVSDAVAKSVYPQGQRGPTLGTPDAGRSGWARRLWINLAVLVAIVGTFLAIRALKARRLRGR